MRRACLVMLLFVPSLFACGGGGGSSASDEAAPESGGSSVARDAVERWTENAEGVASYTVTMDMGGQESTETYVKRVVDGVPVFLPEGAEGQDAMAQFPQLLAAAREEGEGEVDGAATDILVVDDTAALDRVFASQGGPFRATRMEIHVGKDDDLMRQITVSGQATLPDGQAREVTNVIVLGDWREEDGFAYPFRTTTRVEGLSDMIQDAQAEMERQIAQLPEAQREAARQAMASQMQAAQQAASGDAIENVITVKELQVVRE